MANFPIVLDTFVSSLPTDTLATASPREPRHTIYLNLGGPYGSQTRHIFSFIASTGKMLGKYMSFFKAFTQVPFNLTK